MINKTLELGAASARNLFSSTQSEMASTLADPSLSMSQNHLVASRPTLKSLQRRNYTYSGSESYKFSKSAERKKKMALKAQEIQKQARARKVSLNRKYRAGGFYLRLYC